MASRLDQQDPYDLEQDALQRALGGAAPEPGARGSTDPTGTTMPVSPDGLMPPGTRERIDPPAAAAPPGPQGNGVDAREALGGYNNVGTMLGYNTSRDYGGDLKAGNSMKNTFGRLASRYGNNKAGMQSLMNDADFKRYFPNAQWDGEDSINFGGQLSDFESGSPVGWVDLQKAYNRDTGESEGWQWLDQAGQGQGADMQGLMDPGSDLFSAVMGGGDGGNDTLKRIQDELQALINGQPSALAQDSFQQAMR